MNGCCLAAPSLFGAQPLSKQVEVSVIWNVMAAMLRHCKMTKLQNAISVLQMIKSSMKVWRFALL